MLVRKMVLASFGLALLSLGTAWGQTGGADAASEESWYSESAPRPAGGDADDDHPAKGSNSRGSTYGPASGPTVVWVLECPAIVERHALYGHV
jgi:hypothetical protein